MLCVKRIVQTAGVNGGLWWIIVDLGFGGYGRGRLY